MTTLKLASIIAALVGGLSLHAVAVNTKPNGVYTWGRHAGPKPAAVVGVTGTVVQAVTNDHFTFVLNSAGTVFQVLGTTASIVSFPGNEPISFIADPGPAGTEIAVGKNGDAYGWGKNADDQLCLSAKKIADPELLPVSGPLSAVSGQGDHTLFAQKNGELFACGGNGYGDLGNGSTKPSVTPVEVTGFDTNEIVEVATGWRNSGALLSNGQLWEWGYNAYGQLGNGTTTASDVPVQVPGVYTQVSVGGAYVGNGSVLATTSSGQVFGWGNDIYGQLCDGSTANQDLPELISGVPTAKMAIAGGTDGFVLATNGMLYACGQNVDGDLGTGKSANAPRPIRILNRVDSIDATSSVSAALIG